MPLWIGTRRHLQYPRPFPVAAGGGAMESWANRQIWINGVNANLKAEEDGTGTVTDGGGIGWANADGTLSPFVQATEGNRPTWESDDNSIFSGSTLRLERASAINWTGEFTAVFVVNYDGGSGGTVIIPLSAGTGSGDDSTIFFYSDGNVYINVGASQRTVAFTAPDGLMQIFVWRDSSNQMKIIATGMNETNVGTAVSGTMQIQAAFGRPKTSEWSTEVNKFKTIYAGNADMGSTLRGQVSTQLMAAYPGLGALGV